MTEPTDAAVVQRVVAGDVEAFALLVDRHHARMARYAFHLLGSDAEAEEAVQDSFVRAYRSLSTYREQEQFGGWIMRILVNRCRTRLVREKRREETAAAWVRETEQTFFPFEPSERLAMRDELGKALAQLPGDQREAVVLRYADELDYQEISSITGANISALKMRVKRGCERLRALLEASRAGH
ncbi:MAG TPA: sigma-70 family RNA polymerase sigma factor [Gemmatimonadaceae bacterium]|nr:sigma-70 family RNA polymerase sigma factor [Gemmatimonadaceae bacterium]